MKRCPSVPPLSLITVAVIAFALGLSAQTYSECDYEYIINTTHIEITQNFLEGYGAKAVPLISYSNPSEETMKHFGNFYLVSIPKETEVPVYQLIKKIEDLPGVQCVEPNLKIYVPSGWNAEPQNLNLPDTNFDDPYTPNDPKFSEQWDKPITETDWAWNVSTGEDVIIAVPDMGVDTAHEDLVDNLYMGYNFVDNNTDCYDIAGHGTSVCGVAGAKIDNNKGIAGVAGNALIMALRIFTTDGSASLGTIINALNYAADNGAKVISMSWGSYSSLGSLEYTLNGLWDRGIFLCAGAANDNEDTPFYPAAYEKVMGVGATTSADERWTSSNYGTNAQIFAPGGLSTTRGGGYGGVQATSFTTPQIAGLAALIFSAYPYASNQQVWDQIIESADTLQSDVGPILRMNSRKALFKEIVEVTEPQLATSPVISAEGIENGVIRFSVPSYTSYTLRLYDVTGSQVYETSGGTDSRGEVLLEPEIGQGVYFWMVTTPSAAESGKFVYVK